MKKAIARLFLLLATVIIVAHVVTPHHHHGMPVASFVDHHEGCDTSTEEAYCLLETIFIQTQPVKPDLPAFLLLPAAGLLFLFFFIPCLREAEAWSFRQKPYRIASYTAFVSRSLGMRAPPTLPFPKF
jgi:hypothetical protein